MRFLLLLALAMPLALPMTADAADHRPKAPRSAAKSAPVAAGRTAGTVQRSGPVRGQLATSRDARAALSAACTGRKGGRGCRPTDRAARGSWSQGLPPAAGAQARECPDGTLATLARGHDDIVRCMPL